MFYLALASLVLIVLVWLWSLRRRIRLAREVARSEALFNAFFEASRTGMAIFDHELQFVRVNEPLAALYGASADLLVGRALEQVMPELAKGLAPLMREVLVSSCSMDNLEVSISPSARDELHMLVSLFPIHTTRGHNPAGVGAVMQDISATKSAQQALERSHEEVRRLSAHREVIVEREHQRLAREFHDELGQLLTTVRMHLQLLTRQIDDDKEQARNTVRTVDGMIVDAYRSIKTIASDLRPAALNMGLAAAIEWMAGRTLLPSGVACSIECDPVVDKLDDNYVIALFRIIQESFTNVARHAAAGRVRVVVRRMGNGIQLCVEDDGRGFDANSVDRDRQFGLLGISERVAALDGRFHLDSSPGGGARLEVFLPEVPLPGSNPAFAGAGP
jgi:PAS domain S-box-containing protein